MNSALAAESSINAREFELTESEFLRIRKILKERSGIDVDQSKRMLVYGRLARRLRALGLERFAEYLALIEDPLSAESEQFQNALTTNVTELFREEHHFEMLKSKVVPAALKAGAKRLRLWSAGCSAGDEPYSIALTLARMPELSGCDVKILATDIDSQILEQAKAGVYDVERVSKLDIEQRKFFSRGVGANAGVARVQDRIRSMITFKQLNLQGPWPMQGPFDVIFCRNVVIYFDVPTRERLVGRFAELLRPGGYLFMGHSESPSANNEPSLKSCGKTAFIKLPGPESR